MARAASSSEVNGGASRFVRQTTLTRTKTDHLLAHASPLGWSHISLTGDYLWEQAAIAVDGFRPLNTARSRLKLVA